MEYPDDQRVRKVYEWLDTKLPWLPKVKDFVIRIVTSVVNRIGTLLFIVFAVVLGNAISLGLSSPDAASTVPDSTADYSNCNVLAIDIRNCIATYKPDPDSKNTNNCDVITSSEEVMNVIESAKTDDTIKAVLLAIDSTGGMPVAAEEIADAMKGLGKPSVAWVRGGAVSAAYWIASSADTIEEADRKAIATQTALKDLHLQTKIEKNEKESEKYWIVRRESFNLLRKNLHGLHTAPFIDDFVVPPT